MSGSAWWRWIKPERRRADDEDVKRSAEVHRLEWLEGRFPGVDITGYPATGWDASVWIPHAMYETDQLPGGLTYDDLARIERDAGASEPSGRPALDDLLSR